MNISEKLLLLHLTQPDLSGYKLCLLKTSFLIFALSYLLSFLKIGSKKETKSKKVGENFLIAMEHRGFKRLMIFLLNLYVLTSLIFK